MTPLPILDVFLPGSSEIFSFLSHYFKIDITYYLSILLVLTATSAVMKYVGTMSWDLIKRYSTATVEIHQDDEIYNYVMTWISKQPFMRRIPSLLAGVRTESHLIWWTDEKEEEDGKDGYENSFDFTGDFEDYWFLIANRDRFRPVRYTPSSGSHLFKYKGRLLVFERVKIQHYSLYTGTQSERIYISCLGRNSHILKELLEEAQLTYLNRDGDKTVIYRAMKGDGSALDWRRCLSRTCRPLSTVVLDETQKQTIVNDVKEYLNPFTKIWYSNRGIPYRRGYLFHGPPGTGKTSLCFSLAGLFHLKIYAVSLNSSSVTEDGLATLFQDLPLRCIVLMEDIDAAGLTRKRNHEGAAEADEPNDGPQRKRKGEPPGGISLAAVLNVIDGVASSEGRILVMTTNHIEKLDKALIRPGRVDMIVSIGLASKEGVWGIFKTIYTRLEEDLPAGMSAVTSSRDAKPNRSHANGGIKRPVPTDSKLSEKATQPQHFSFAHNYTNEQVASLADRFAEIIPANEFTPAEVQGYLLKHKYDPQEAIEGASAWVQSMREERQRAKEEEEASGSEDSADEKEKVKGNKKNKIKSKAKKAVKVEKVNGVKEIDSGEEDEETGTMVNGVKEIDSEEEDKETGMLTNGVKGGGQL